MILSTDWMLNSTCSRIDPELFFEKTTIGVAKRICKKCDVLNECLSYALSVEIDLHGVWGGTTRSERDSIRHFNLYFSNRKEAADG